MVELEGIMKNNNYSEGLLKGRIAESLFEELLKKSGNKVYRFGYEAILQNLTQIQKNFDVESETGCRIRAIPDFVVVNNDGVTDFIEVKFRWNGKLHEKDHQRLKRPLISTNQLAPYAIVISRLLVIV